MFFFKNNAVLVTENPMNGRVVFLTWLELNMSGEKDQTAEGEARWQAESMG